MSNINDLVSFDGTDGDGPEGSLAVDSAGNLYGTTTSGGASNDGTVFEIADTASGYATTPTTLASFDGTDGLGPSAGLVFDAAGNLYGTTAYGGALNTGSVFEVAKTASGYATTPTTLSSFAMNRGLPKGDLIAEGGNLFGTAQVGGTAGDGSVFEVAETASGLAMPTTVASFDGTNGNGPVGGLITDAAGNIYGTAKSGGASFARGTPGYGTVFEVAKTASGYNATPTALVSFTGADGEGPSGSLIMDAAGNLFGTTVSGGSTTVVDGSNVVSGDGTVFEIAKTASGYATTPTTLATFTGGNGSAPEGGLIMDAAGNLFGTTSSGGANDDGTVFEIAKSGSGYAAPVTVQSFDGADGSTPSASLFADAAGNLYGTTQGGGASEDGTVFEITDSGFVVCFASGTRIRTARGDVAVEALAVGDRVVTASGATRSIRWLGHRTIDCRSHPCPANVHPVRIAAHAFGAGLPVCDLSLSPGHPVLVGADEDGAGGHLVPIMCLVNGTTIERETVEAVTYWHVELDAHDILLAEGLPAESYLDWGDRPFFHEGSDHALHNPDFVVPGLAGRCRPVALDGPVVEAERRRLELAFAGRLAAACAWPDAGVPFA